VDQASNNVLQTGAFARRVVCRTLTVVGGVAAGTALAWWLAAGAASADVEPVVQQDPAAQVQEFVAPVTGPVEKATETVADYLQDPPPPPRDPLKDLGDKVTDAADTFRDRAAQSVEDLPDCSTTVCVGDEPGHEYLSDGYGRADFPTKAAAPAAVAEATGVDPDAVADRTAKDRASSDGMSRRGSPALVQPSVPDLPTWPTPHAPVLPSVPATGNNSQAGNSADSHLFAALPWQDNTFDLAARGLSATTASVTFGRPGAQPGVAPD
jgi:hypothetical protein